MSAGDGNSLQDGAHLESLWQAALCTYSLAAVPVPHVAATTTRLPAMPAPSQVRHKELLGNGGREAVLEVGGRHSY